MCCAFWWQRGFFYFQSHTHIQSHIMGKSLVLMLRHWPWQRKRAHFSSFILLLSPSLSWSGAQLISTPLLSFSPSTSVCCSLHPPDAQAQKLCCIYSALHFALLYGTGLYMKQSVIMFGLFLLAVLIIAIWKKIKMNHFYCVIYY